ncbi:MAG: type II secretion system protein GspG [Planctomycetota bacterium]|nr:type II secretion system protein GspG [Planctomycetota bacterium]MDA1139735.1 type II secretion system protein GspG [Planctomycetota bacterium]
MVTAVKFAIPVALLGFAASYMDIVSDILNTVKASLTGIELAAIDDALQRERFMSGDGRTDPFPADQEGFIAFMGEAFEDKGRKNTNDQFGTEYQYHHPEKTEQYSIASAGPDKGFGSEDDIVLRREGKKRTMSKELGEIAKDMETEIGKEKTRKKEQIKKLNEAISAANGDSNAESGAAAGGNTGAAMTDLLNNAQKKLDDLRSSIDLGEKAEPLEWDDDLNGLGAGE